jgi:hypothetical protein
MLRELPRNLKALAPEAVPFDARLWARGDPAERSRAAAAVAWLRDHPGFTARDAARENRLSLSSLVASAPYRELRAQRQGALNWRPGRRTGGLERGLHYLAENRPASINEVGRAAGVGVRVLSRNAAFRRRWEAYARTAQLDPRSRSHYGKPRKRRSR